MWSKQHSDQFAPIQLDLPDKSMSQKSLNIELQWYHIKVWSFTRKITNTSATEFVFPHSILPSLKSSAVCRNQWAIQENSVHSGGTADSSWDICLSISLTWAHWKIRASVFHLKPGSRKKTLHSLKGVYQQPSNPLHPATLTVRLQVLI